MTTTQITKDNLLEVPIVIQVEEKQYKTPSYTRRAITNYYNKHKEEVEFKLKKAEYNKKYYETKTKEKNFPIINIVDLINTADLHKLG